MVDMWNEMSDETKFYVIALIAIFAIVIFLYILKYRRDMRTNPALTRYERWCVRLSVFLSALNNNLMNSLAVRPYTGKNSGQLKAYWGIGNREEYEASMSKYKAGERRKQYDQYVEYIKNHPGVTDESIAATEDCDARKLAFVRETYPKLTANSILAFDYGTYAFLTRVAYNETILTKDEAIANLREAGALAKDKFTSWDEFIYSYYAGAVFSWADSPKSVKNYQQVMKQSLAHCKTVPFAWKNEK